MAAINLRANRKTPITAPPAHIVGISPSDSTDLAYATTGINASADCTIQAETVGGETVTGYPLHKGYNPGQFTRIYRTGTTLGGATIWALW